LDKLGFPKEHKLLIKKFLKA